MSFLRFMCEAGIYQLVKIKLWLLWRGKKMLEFNQSDCSGFDSLGPSLVGFCLFFILFLWKWSRL